MRLLLIEDNADLADAIIRRMRRHGHAVRLAERWSGCCGRVLRCRDAVHLVVLDIGLPSLDGLQLLSELRQRGDTTPVLIP